MSDKPTTLQDEITNAVTEALKNTDFVTETISKKVKETVESSIEDMFRWGDAKKVIQKKLEDIMIPAIETYDFGSYIQRLDVVINELLHNPDIICNNKILSNFKTVMTPPDVKTITLKELFDEYCVFVAKNIDTNGRDVIFDGDGPYYEPIECVLESENIKSPYDSTGSERYMLSFHTEEDNAKTEYNESLNVDVVLHRWGWMKSGEYRLNIFVDPCSIKNMSDFEAFIYSLSTANITVNIEPGEHIASGIRFDDSVAPEKEPEPTYS